MEITIDTRANTYQAEQDLDELWNKVARFAVDQTAKSILTMTSMFGSMKFFANGGLASEGQMFIAREAGPELVGTVGGHSAVMNNDQIVQSVSAGVYQAVVSAMGGQSDRPIVLEINGKEFAKATYSDFQDESSRRGTNTALRRN